MSLAITHFAVGAGCMTLLLTLWAPTLAYRQTVIVLSGLWALIPDLHYVSPVLQGPLSQLKFTVLGDVFWFHRSMDALESGRGSRTVAAVAVVCLLGVTVTTEYYQRRFESV